MASAQLSAEGKDVFCEDVLKQLNAEGSDVQIRCGSRTFRSNRCYLTAASPKLAEMLKANKDIDTIIITDVQQHIFHELLQYIYYAKLDNLDMDIAPELYQAASTYRIQPLKSLCGSYMMKNMSENTVCTILSAVAKCESKKNSSEDERLIAAVKTFISNNKEFLRTSTWTSFSAEYPEVADLIR